MGDSQSEPVFLIDTSGLSELARTKSNSLKDFCLDLLENGDIAVPTIVWKEFSDLYDEEAAQLAPSVTKKIKVTKKHYVAAAQIADKSNPGFSMSPYDNQSDWYTAAICYVKGYTLLTSASQMAKYKKMNCCTVTTLGSITTA